MVFAGLGQLGGLLHGVVQRAELVDQLDGQGVGGQPDAALGYLVHLVAGHLAALGHDVEERLVAAVNIRLHVFQLLGVVLAHDQVFLEVGVLVGLRAVEGHAQLAGQQLAEVGHQSEDADAARDRRGLGKDVVAVGAHHVAARSGHAAHRDDHRLLGLQPRYGVGYLLGGDGRPAGRVDAQHDGLHVVVVGQLVQVVHRLVADDAVLGGKEARLLVDDFAVGVVDGHLVALLLVGRRQTYHVGQHQLVHLAVDAQPGLDGGLNVLGVHHLVDESTLDVVVGRGEGHDAVVHDLVYLFGAESRAALGHVLQHVLPDAPLVGVRLLAVLGAHVLAQHALDGTLVLAHAHHLVAHADLLVESRQELTLAADALQLDHRRAVQVQAVGHRGHVVALLAEVVGVGDDPLAALLEVLQCVAHLLCRRGGVDAQHAALQVDALDAVVGLGLAYAGHDVVEAHHAHVGAVQQHVEGRALLGALLHVAVELQHEH